MSYGFIFHNKNIKAMLQHLNKSNILILFQV